jgi:hypothetical protein
LNIVEEIVATMANFDLAKKGLLLAIYMIRKGKLDFSHDYGWRATI